MISITVLSAFSLLKSFVLAHRHRNVEGSRFLLADFITHDMRSAPEKVIPFLVLMMVLQLKVATGCIISKSIADTSSNVKDVSIIYK